MSLLTPLQNKYVEYTLDKETQNAYATGKNGRRGNTQAPVLIDLCVIPMDPRTVEADESGRFKLQDIKIYREGEDDQLPQGSVLNYKSKKYRISVLSNRVDNGGFTIWHGKLITE